MAHLPLSIIVLTYNEEHNIAPCLESLAPLGTEIFILDSGSSDRTLEIAARYSPLIFHHPFENYTRQRNWAQTNLPLSYDWVFHIDADERLSVRLLKGLVSFFDSSHHEILGLLVRRRIEVFGKHIRHGGIYPSYHCRIFRKQHGRCEDRLYDQHFIVDGATACIEADLIESTAPSLFSWTARHNRWAQMEAQYLSDPCYKDIAKRCLEPRLSGSHIQRRRWYRQNLYEKGPLFFRAIAYFVWRYFIRG